MCAEPALIEKETGFIWQNPAFFNPKKKRLFLTQIDLWVLIIEGAFIHSFVRSIMMCYDVLCTSFFCSKYILWTDRFEIPREMWKHNPGVTFVQKPYGLICLSMLIKSLCPKTEFVHLIRCQNRNRFKPSNNPVWQPIKEAYSVLFSQFFKHIHLSSLKRTHMNRK